MRGVGTHMGHLNRVAGTKRIPGVHDVIVAERYVYPGVEHLLYLQETPTFWIPVEATLEVKVHERIAHEIDTCLLYTSDAADE